MIDYGHLNLAIALCSVTVLLVLTLKNVFLKVRRKFKIRVNCWFCPSSVPSFWVPYDNYNSFDCIHCGQYNGFDEDGDYNCLIKAQHYKSLNSTTNSVRSEENVGQLRSTNGLCTLCNRNQELKISQLASYVPEFEDNYDYEIEEYTKKLEQCYKLCSSCERAVKRSLVNVKRNILANLAQKNLNKTRIDDFNEVRHRAMSEKRNQWILRGVLYSLLALALANLYFCASSANISRAELEQIFPLVLVNGIVMTVAHLAAVKALLIRYLLDNSVAALCRMGLDNLQLAFLWISDSIGVYQLLMSLKSAFADLDMIGVSALALNLFIISVSKPANREIVLYSILTWTASMTLASVAVVETHYQIIGLWTLLLLKFFIAFVTVILASHSLTLSKTAHNVANLSTSLHKIHSECGSEDFDNTDDENDVSYQSVSSSKSTPSTGGKSSVRRPTSPFTLTPRLTPALLKNFEQSQNNFEGSFNASFCGNSVANKSFLGVPTHATAPSFRSEVRSVSSIANGKTPGYDENIFRENIDRLRISEAASRQQLQPERSNPFYKIHDDSRPQTPTEFSYCVRKRTPPQPIPTAAPVSWIAGGYWTQSSPQKHQKFEAPQVHDNNLGFYPIMSRTSSQSSGFESYAPNSRENSVFPDMDRFSVYSEPIKNQFNAHPFGFNRTEKTSNYSKNDHRNYFSLSNAVPSPVFSQFGTQRLTSPMDKKNPSNGFLRKGSIFNLDKINSTLTNTS